MRPWPKHAVAGKAVTAQFVAAYRKAFDADPDATWCAGEIDGVTIVVAVGDPAQYLQRFVEHELGGVVQRKS